MENRVIKFRAWDATTDNPRMINWNELQMFPVNTVFIPPSREVFLMQFTGLKDKNGKEIYEGDIIEDITKDSDTGEIIKSRETVYFDITLGSWMLDQSFKQDKSFGYSLFESLNDFEYSIIGNKFENPGLLNTTPMIIDQKHKNFE